MTRTMVMGLATVAAVMSGWYLAALALADPFFPTPPQVFRRAQQLWFTPAEASSSFAGTGLQEHVVPSLTRTVGAWGVAVAVGIVVGVWLGRSPVLAWVDPALQLARALPPPLLVPVVVSLLPLGAPVQVTIIFTGCLWPVMIAAVDGSRDVDSLLIATARLNGATGMRLLLRVTLPAAAGRIAAGVRVSVSLALVLMVVSEMVASTEGIGFQLVDAARSFDAAGLWATVLLLGVLGNVLNAALRCAEHRLLPWLHSGAGAVSGQGGFGA
ncbi:ABC transporter permease subunit [Streptomyces sp. NPDC005500]|uniref:ABC transporter permease n=1 Tax=Streptomyces sp. NPDC005500 TaxID=3155007 RepID=UPI0033BA7729